MSAEEVSKPWVLVCDRSGSYLSAWASSVVADGAWTRRPGPSPLPLPGEVKRTAGYWLLDRVELGALAPAGLPDPFLRHRGPDAGPVWVTTPLAELAAELAAGKEVTVLQAWTAAEAIRPLDGAAKRLSAARERLIADARPAAAVALDALKAGYAAATSWFEYGPQPPSPLARPQWRRAILDRYVANTWRSLAKADVAPFDHLVGRHPDPRPVPADVPAGLVHGQRRRAVRPGHQLFVHRDQVGARGARRGPAYRPGGHVDPEMGEDLGATPEAQAEAVVQPRRPRLGGRPDPRARRAEGVGDLLGVAALDAALAAVAVPDRHVEPGGHHLGLGHVDLPLGLVAVVDHRAPAVGTAGWKWRIELTAGRRRRRHAMAVAAVALARLAPRCLRVGLGATLENGAAWRLPARRDPSNAFSSSSMRSFWAISARSLRASSLSLAASTASKRSTALFSRPTVASSSAALAV
ncbi:MAG TPA: hypothetical protein VG184_01010 [Acidimicrobiales bacterium]|jgi:hypothetical protein|nr:hypothetical protein [Acidimicrobiales bacterium]